MRCGNWDDAHRLPSNDVGGVWAGVAVAISWRVVLRRGLPDVAGLALAFVHGLPSLAYRLGHDQAMFFYIGREWLHGRIPYRDAFDVKPPGIYAVYALSIALFGERLWAPRLLELFAVLGMGACVAYAIRRDRPIRPGEIGLGAMLVSSFYFANLDHWDTAQSEFWEALFLIGAVCAVERSDSRRTGGLVGGALVACAVLFKPTAAVVGLVVLLMALARGWAPNEGPTAARVRRAALAGAWCVVGGSAVLGLFLGYFAAHGALHHLSEFLGYMRQYRSWPSGEPAALNAQIFWLFRGGLWTAFWIASAAIACLEVRGRKAHGVLRGIGWALALSLASVESIAMQGKWLWYHWGVVTPFVAMLGMYGLSELARPRIRNAMIVGTALLLAGFYSSPRWISNNNHTYQSFTRDVVWEWIHGRLTDAALSEVFRIGGSYNYRVNESVALHIRARARSGDTMHVRSYEPTLYVIAGLRTPTRWPSEYPLEQPGLEYHRAEWIAERDRVLWSALPRFIVTYADRLDDIADIERHGYHEMYREAMFVVMERNQSSALPAARGPVP